MKNIYTGLHLLLMLSLVPQSAAADWTEAQVNAIAEAILDGRIANHEFETACPGRSLADECFNLYLDSLKRGGRWMELIAEYPTTNQNDADDTRPFDLANRAFEDYLAKSPSLRAQDAGQSGNNLTDENDTDVGRVEIPTANHCVRIINNREVGDYVRLRNICNAPIVVYACYTTGTTEKIVGLDGQRCAETGFAGDGHNGQSLVGNRSGTIDAGVTVIGPSIYEAYHELVVMACERHPEHNPDGGVVSNLNFTNYGQSFRCSG